MPSHRLHLRGDILDANTREEHSNTQQRLVEASGNYLDSSKIKTYSGSIFVHCETVRSIACLCVNKGVSG